MRRIEFTGMGHLPDGRARRITGPLNAVGASATAIARPPVGEPAAPTIPTRASSAPVLAPPTAPAAK